MLGHQVFESEKNRDRQAAVIVLPGYDQTVRDFEPILSDLCREMVRIVVHPPRELRRGSKVKPAWIDVDARQRPLKFSPEQTREGAYQVAEFAMQVREMYEVSRVYAVGFSQGGIIAAHAVDAYAQCFNGVVISHGSVVPEALYQEKTPCPPLYAVFSEPSMDAVMSPEHREHLLAWMAVRGRESIGYTNLPVPHVFNAPVAQVVSQKITHWDRNRK